MAKFLDRINYTDLFPFLNVNEQMQKLAREGSISLTGGKELLKFCLYNKLRSEDSQHDIIDIDLATNEVWNSRLTNSQKRQFTKFANNVIKARNSNYVDLIVRITVPQKTNSEFETDFLRGVTSFNGDRNLESLFLPLGVVYGDSFQ